MPNDHYVYAAIFGCDEDSIYVHFPDLRGAITCGDTYEEAFEMARECLSLHLYGMEADGDDIPPPTPFINIVTEADEVVQLIHVWLPLAREYQRIKAREKAIDWT
jgi:predicted RNase H-like HicB family nuclease